MNGIIEKARTVAILAHGDQRYGDEPYSAHLQAVVDVLQRFGANLNESQSVPLFAAAWLHDSLEDTDLTRDELAAQFGDVISDLVWRVSDEPGASRRERKAATYGKIAAVDAAIVLKLADRIANLESALDGGGRLLRMYVGEHGDFKAALHRPPCPPVLASMWAHLEALIVSAANLSAR